MLEEAGCKVSTHTDGKWKVITHWGEVIAFKRDVWICNRMPYINLREHAEGLAVLETVENNMEMFIKKEIERAELLIACSTATMCAHHGRTFEANCKSEKSKEHPH